MIVNGSIIVEKKVDKEIMQFLERYIEFFQIKLTVEEYDYFSIEEYLKTVDKSNVTVSDNLEYIEVLKNTEFLSEIEINVDFNSIVKRYTPCFSDYIAQSVSLAFSCKSISYLKPLQDSNNIPITLFSNGEVEINFMKKNPESIWCWENVPWMINSSI